MIKEGFWKLFYSRWKNPLPPTLPGYSVLLPVPGDLPVFLKIAIQICKKQSQEGAVEFLVIPDIQTPVFKKAFEEEVKNWPQGHLKLVPLRPIDKFVISLTNNPAHIHWIQMIRGIDAALAKYAILHDADLFLTDKDFFKHQFERIRFENLNCLGISEVSDPWYVENGFRNIVSTWEMFFSTEWVRNFAPWELHRRFTMIEEKKHVFDTLLWAQCKSDPAKIGVEAVGNRAFHFNYVISTYRWFQKAHGSFEDEYFRLLFIRLLHEVLKENDEEGCEVPPVEMLAKGIEKKENAPVTYRGRHTWDNYPEFRGKLQALLESPIFEKRDAEKIQEKILPFDKAFH